MFGYERPYFRPRKRIEIEKMADKKRPRAPERTAEQRRLTRRTVVFKGLSLASFATLTGRLWQLQIRDHVKARAAQQVFSQYPIYLPAARGLIYDRAGQLIVDNLKSWGVAIVPAGLPTDDDAATERAKQDAIFQALAQHLQMYDIVTIAPAELPKDQSARDEIYQRLAAAVGLPVDEVRDPIENEFATAKKYKRDPQSALKVPAGKQDLPPDKVEAARAASRDLLGVHVVNPIAYQVRVYGAANPYVPLVVKADIPKEVALGIEANRIYLPGVQIDDSGLKRRYLVGEEMGHILGYTGAISAEEWKAAIMRDERGQPLLDEDGDPKHIYRQDDYVGKAGIEAGLEEALRGTPGQYVAKIDAEGKIVGEYPQYRRNATDGNSIVLTIPLDYQREVKRILEEGIARVKPYIEDQNAKAKAEGRPDKVRPIPVAAGAAVALDPRNGEVLAMVSAPGYNPQDFASGISQQKLDEYLEKTIPDDQKRHPLQDRCAASNFPPGSTLKSFISAAGLQERVIQPDSKIRCLGRIEVPYTFNEYQRTNYPCWTRDAQHQDLTVKEALAVSCDVFFYVLGGPKQKDLNNVDTHYYEPNGSDMQWFNGLGIQRINNYLQAFGFGSRTGIELGSEVKGLVPGIEWKADNFDGPDGQWSLGDTINTSIGQGYDLASPLQLCNATAAIANRGTLYKPTLVHQVVDGQGQVVRGPSPTVIRKLPVDPAHLDVVREGMRMNVTWHRDNTVKGLVAPTFDDKGQVVPNTEQFPLPQELGFGNVGVKTGTAEYGSEIDDDGLHLRAHAWTAAFAPYDNPEICVVAFVEGGAASSTIAAPIASGMITAWFARKANQR